MRLTSSLLPLVVSLLVPITARPQDGVHVEVLGGPLWDPSYSYDDPHVGWTAGVGVGLDLRPEVHVVYGVSLCRFPGGHWAGDDLYIPWEPVGATSGGVQRWEPSFHDGYEVSAAVRLGAPGARVGSYISLGAGVHSARFRRKSSFVWQSKPPGHHWDWVTNGFTSAGVGVTIPVEGSWKLLVEGRLTMGTDGETVFVPLIAGLQLRL